MLSTLIMVAVLGQSAPVKIVSQTYQLPVVKVTAPDTVEPGEIVIVSADVDKSSLPPNLQIVKLQWIVWQDGVPKPDVIAWPDNSKVIFAAGSKPRVFTVLLDVDCLYGKLDEQKKLSEADIFSPDIVTKTIKVAGGPSPTPGPDPTPTPVPVPPAPTPDLTGNSKIVYDFVMSLPNFTPAERYKLARAFATSYEGVAAQIAALGGGDPSTKLGTVDINTYLSMAKTSNSAILASSGINPTRLSEVRTALGTWVEGFYTRGLFNTRNDITNLYQDIAKGLKAVPNG